MPIARLSIRLPQMRLLSNMNSSSKKENQSDIHPIRQEYVQHGVRGFYEQFGNAYRNPHEAAISAVLHEGLSRWQVDLSCVLDLACGSGEVTLALQELGCTAIDGIDPYTVDAYRARTGREAEPVSFEQIADGVLEGRRYSLIVCSFALHLLTESRLPVLTYQLSRLTPTLIVLTPHKRPRLREAWGWRLEDEIVVRRVRARLYRAIVDP